ncbi:MAG TPA: glycosyltransferase [Planctomycetota bacterium]|nr:glycosyltransferase [Planctomycetota bacterium]
MRLTLVAAHFPPHFLGGTEQVVLAQARELSRRGVEVRVVAGTDRPAVPGEDCWRENVAGIPVTFLPRLPAEVGPGEGGRERLRPLLARELAGSDIVHVHGTSTLTQTLVRDAARDGTRPRPVIYSIHDHFPACPRSFRWRGDGEACPELPAEGECASCLAPELGLASGLDGPADERGTGRNGALDKLAAALGRRRRAAQEEVDAAALVTVPSFAHRLSLGRHLNLRRAELMVIPPGLCLALPNLHPRPSLFRAGSGEPLRVLHFGNLCAAKGTLDLARALGMLPAGSARLVLAGHGLDLDLGRRLVAGAPGLPVDIYGAYDGAALERIAADCHLAAFPSRLEESFGLVVDEALALGMVTWVSDRGAPQDRIGAAGRVLPAEDPAAWGAAFAGLLAESPGAELATERAAVPKETFDAADAAEEWLSVYRSLLRSAPSGRSRLTG